MELSIEANGKDQTEVSNNCFTSETLSALSNGLVQIYKPSLFKVKQQLNELTGKQAVLIDQLHNENMKLSWSQNSDEFQEIFNMIKLYRNKLFIIKKEMKSLHDRIMKLKKRAVRLQQHKEKELYIKNQHIKQEQDLIAKPSPSVS